MSDIHSPDSIKMIRETLCLAEAALIDRVRQGMDADAIRRGHLKRITRLIEDIDRQRPLGPDGKHGDRHTDTCGCDK